MMANRNILERDRRRQKEEEQDFQVGCKAYTAVDLVVIS